MVKAYLELDDMVAMERAATNLRDRLLIRMLSRLGCRISEVLGLTLQDVDFTGGTVTIKHLKAHPKLSCTVCGQRLGITHAFCPNCGSRIDKVQVEQQERRRQRVLPVYNDTLKLLNEYVQHGGPVAQNGEELIFGINRHRAWQIISKCAERAGLPKLENPETGRVHNVSPQRLREAFAVHAMKLDDSGDGLRLLQEHWATRVSIPPRSIGKWPGKNIGSGIKSSGNEEVHGRYLCMEDLCRKKGGLTDGEVRHP